MANQTELRRLRQEAESIAQTGEHGTWLTVHAVMQQCYDQAILRELFQLPLMPEGITNVCQLARHA